MKDLSIPSQKVGGRNFEEEFGQALFFLPPPQCVPCKTKIETDCRLSITHCDLKCCLASQRKACQQSLLEMIVCIGREAETALAQSITWKVFTRVLTGDCTGPKFNMCRVNLGSMRPIQARPLQHCKNL